MVMSARESAEPRVFPAFNATSVPNSSSANSESSGCTDKCRVFIESAGADITVSLQASADGGTTWLQVAAYAAGVTGVQAVADLPGPLVRLRAANAHALNAQAVTAKIVING